MEAKGNDDSESVEMYCGVVLIACAHSMTFLSHTVHSRDIGYVIDVVTQCPEN